MYDMSIIHYALQNTPYNKFTAFKKLDRFNLHTNMQYNVHIKHNYFKFRKK